MAQPAEAPAYTVVCRADDADWLKLRQTGIGASEAAALLGENPWKSLIQLYAEKTGALPPDDLSDNEAVFWGTRLEAIVREVYAERSKRLIDKGGLLLRSNRYPWALCTLDGWTSDRELGPYWVLEIKTAGANKAADWADGCPEAYRVQVMWQLLVTDAPRGTIACLLGGQRLVWCDVERDEALIRKLVHHGSEFWDRVQRHEPPQPDGSESARRVLGALYPEDTGSTVELSGPLLDVADELEQLKIQKKTAEARERELENLVKAELGTALRGVLPDGREWVWSTEKRAAYTVPAGSRRVLRMKQGKQ